MSLDSQLIHTCTIENPTTGSVNVYNNASKSYGTPLVNVRCRLVEADEETQSDEVTEAVVKTTYKLLVHKDTTLLEKAKISSVVIDGETITDVFEVVSVLNRNSRRIHHKTALLERIS